MIEEEERESLDLEELTNDQWYSIHIAISSMLDAVGVYCPHCQAAVLNIISENMNDQMQEDDDNDAEHKNECETTH